MGTKYKNKFSLDNEKKYSNKKVNISVYHIFDVFRTVVGFTNLNSDG
jgi:hypothetical protein